MSQQSPITREELMKEAFELLQKNGRILKSSIGTALRAAGLNPSEEKIKSILSTTTSDIDMNEYQQLVEQNDDGSDSVEAIREAFKIFDKDQNGTVSVQEFRHIMTTMGEKYTDEEFRELVYGFDDGGILHYEKFITAMLAPFTQHVNTSVEETELRVEV